MVYEDTPIAFWPLNDPSGMRAYDMMFLQSNGTYVGTVPRTELGPLAKDLENTALPDQGSIQLPLTALKDSITNQMSVELWVKNTSLGSVSIIADWLAISVGGGNFR